jgi:hypothetical protein
MASTPEVVPKFVILFGKACSLLVLILAVLPLVRVGERMTMQNRLMALAFLYMISNPIAPVTWAHGYIPSVIGLAVCWVQAFRTGISTPKLIFLSACTIAVSSFAIHTGMAYFVDHGRRDIFIVALSAFTPIAIVILSLTSLASLEFNDVREGVIAFRSPVGSEASEESFAH